MLRKNGPAGRIIGRMLVPNMDFTKGHWLMAVLTAVATVRFTTHSLIQTLGLAKHVSCMMSRGSSWFLLLQARAIAAQKKRYGQWGRPNFRKGRLPRWSEIKDNHPQLLLQGPRKQCGC